MAKKRVLFDAAPAIATGAVWAALRGFAKMLDPTASILLTRTRSEKGWRPSRTQPTAAEGQNSSVE